MAQFNISRHPRVTFPLPFYPTNQGWRHGKYDQRQFGGPRDGGARRHAGVDLEAPIGTAVLAMADGIVLRANAFYMRTDEIDVLHPGVGIIRYGEILNGSALHRKTFVRQGQQIAVIGQRHENGTWNPRAMLHLELYTDVSRTAPLGRNLLNGLSQDQVSQPGHPSFDRRSDLKDPTELLESAQLYKASSGIWPET